MGDGRQRGGLTPRLAWTFAAVFLCATLPARVAVALYWTTGPAGAAATVGVFVLPFLYTVPRGRVLWARHRGWLLAAQVVLTYLPFVVFGERWVLGLSGLLGGVLLLALTAPASWILFGAVIVVEGVLRIGFFGIVQSPGESMLTWVFTVPVNLGLTLFGLVRLGDLVTDLHAAQSELAELAVTQERLRSADRLQAAIGDRLMAVTARAQAAFHMLPRSPEQARGQLTEAAGIARQALDLIRDVVTTTRDHGPPEPRTREEGLDAVDASGSERAGGTVAPRLARFVLVTVLCSIAAQLLGNALAAGNDVAGTMAIIVMIAALQLYHSTGGEDVKPRAWRWTLTAQALLTFAFFPEYEWNILGMAGFTAGSVALLLPGRWAWTGFAGVVAGVGALSATLPDLGALDLTYITAVTATTGLVVYGLSRLTHLAVRVAATRRELARMAVVRERLRVARDVHDLLGLGLSAIALKSDLTLRLIGRDQTRARDELASLVEIATKARSDIRSVTEDDHRVSLHAELASARTVLTSAGVLVRVYVPEVPIPTDVDAVLATVLREAVTNILRHATARQCTIALSTGEAGVMLRISNDGVPDARPPRRHGGRGLANLTARTATLGGRLTTRTEGRRFHVTAEIPLRVPA